MSKFWQLVEQSVLITGVVTIGLLSAFLYLVVTGQEVPDILQQLLYIVMGFFFGAKAQKEADRRNS